MVFKDNLGSDLMISSEFGEFLLGYYLVKQGLTVVRANTEGCDLFVVDNKGEVFKGRKNKNKMIGIEVKTRQSPSPSVYWDDFNIKLSSEQWNFDPYFCIITQKEIVMIPLNITRSRLVKTSNDHVSLSRIKKLRKKRKYAKKIILLEWQMPKIVYKRE